MSKSIRTTASHSQQELVRAMENASKTFDDGRDDSTLRHQKLLSKIVKILKINDLLEDYRKILLNIQATCACKRTRTFLDEFGHVESKYKELIIRSLNGHRHNTSTGDGDHHNNGTLIGGVEDLCYAILDSDVEDDGQNGQSPGVTKRNDLNNNATNSANTINNTSANRLGASSSLNGASLNGLPLLGEQDDDDDDDDDDDEEGEEDEDEDDFEDELDIEEYMALSEVIEKEEALMEKIADEDSHFINVIRYSLTKEVICYECLVGGSCGFLTRERSRMLLHIGKHFQMPMIEAPATAGNDRASNLDISITPISFGNDKVLGATTTTTTSASSGGKSQPLRLAGSSTADASSIVKPILTSILTAPGTGGCTAGVFTSQPSFVSYPGAMPLAHVQQFRTIVPVLSTGGQVGTIVASATAPSTCAPVAISNPATAVSSGSGTVMKTLRTPLNKPIRCPVANCAFTCDQNYKLRTHNRQVHEKVRPYHCDWPGCFGAYKTRSNLASHRMVHTGEKPFVCNFASCGAKFARKYDCERHRRIHSEKMYACRWPGCGKKLCDPYNLERHMMVHKGELPFRCPITNCVRGFRELRYLRDHVINSHKYLPDSAELRMHAALGANLAPGTPEDNDSNRALYQSFLSSMVKQEEAGQLGQPGDCDNDPGAGLLDAHSLASLVAAANAHLDQDGELRAASDNEHDDDDDDDDDAMDAGQGDALSATAVTNTAAVAIAAAAQEKNKKLQQQELAKDDREAKAETKTIETTITPEDSDNKAPVSSASTTIPRAKIAVSKVENNKKTVAVVATSQEGAKTAKAVELKSSSTSQVAPVSKHNLRSRPTPPTAVKAASLLSSISPLPPSKKAKRK